MREEEDREARTVSVRNEFKRIRTEEELRKFFDQNKETFGMHHNTAYRKFMKMLEYLKKSPRRRRRPAKGAQLWHRGDR